MATRWTLLYVRANGIFAGSLRGEKAVKILPDRAATAYVLPRDGLPGQLLFVRGERLFAQESTRTSSNCAVMLSR